jgi:beta-hydroxylase
MTDVRAILLMRKLLFFFNKVFALTSKVPLQPLYREIFMLNEALVIWNNFEIFRDEASSIYTSFNTIKNDMFYYTLIKTESEWTRLYLSWQNKTDPKGKQLCPRSSALIESMPNIKMAMFSVLSPGAKIKAHTGPYRGCIRLHMGLITPNSDECFINIDGKNYSWRDGEVVLLDDSYLHYVENNTDKYRVILICDILRPMNFVGNIANEIIMRNFSKYTHREG